MEKKKILRTNGFTCPICHGFIEGKIEDISNGGKIVCPHCGLKINISFEPNEKAIEILKKLKNK